MSSEALRLARQVRTARNLDDALAHADRVLERARSRSQRLKGRGARAAGPTKAERKAATKKETTTIRAACVARAAGFGELCGKPLDVERAELCHLDGGIGSRTQDQSVRNCVMEHHECHRGPLGFDKRPMAWFGSVQAWAWRHGYEVPAKYQRLFALRNREAEEARR